VSNFPIIPSKIFHKSWEIRHLCTCKWLVCELFSVIDEPFLPRSLFSCLFIFSPCVSLCIP